MNASPVLLADVVDRADVGVAQCGCSPRLAAETFQRLGVVRHFSRQELQRDKPAKASVFGLVHHPMPPPSFSRMR